MNPTLKKILTPLASLRLTVTLIALSMLLIYAGTWAQIDSGVWQVQHKYFHSLFTWIDFATFLPRPRPGAGGQFHVPGGFPMLGGYSIGILLLANLLAAHTIRFKLRLNRIGIILIHLGLILLLVGEGVSSAFQVESRMPIEEGQTANYSEDIRTSELAIIDTTPTDHDDVAVIPASQLRSGAVINHSGLPVNVRVESYYPNSSLLGPMQARNDPRAAPPRATAGAAVGISIAERHQASGTDTDNVDFPSAYVTLTADNKNLGTYLVSTVPNDSGRPLLPPQEFQLNGKRYQIALRFKRLYHPYAMRLIEFRFDRYLGTSVAKNFSSLIHLTDPQHNVERDVRIWMNNPLRYRQTTFFQADWNKETERGTVLQVVQNPGWMLPYLACILGGLGLLIHFGIKLVTFITHQPRPSPTDARARRGAAAGSGYVLEPRNPWLSLPMLISLGAIAGVHLCTLYSILRPVDPPSGFDTDTFAILPVSYEGRIQPLDTLARNSLKIIGGRDSAHLDIGRLSASRWLADVIGQPEKAAAYPIFRIDHPELLTLLNLDAARKYFSLKEILESKDKLQEQLNRLPESEKDRDLFQRKLAELGEKLSRYIQLGQLESLYLAPPLAPGESWQPLGRASESHPALKAYVNLIQSYHDDQPATFNHEVRAYAALVQQKLPQDQQRVSFERAFNRVDPFTQCIALYLFALVLIFLSWLFWGTALRRAAGVAVVLALLIHTAGLFARIYISGRPPVTNLASSAIFIAWGAVILSMGLEYFFRNGIGSATAAMIGFLSLLIADRLALSGDTLKVLQAVLDTNFWLATHVVMVTLGYAATFLAGVLGIAYVITTLLSGFQTRTTPLAPDKTSRPNPKDLTRMIYGIVCFAMLFSFIGTILGGIWADQSWGRFWGWDPKENGAVLIVLANALLLHARWGGLVRDRGIASLAIFGNIVTAWSWFGTNMLGVGLHSYGFMDSALQWLLLFVISQIALIIVANLPLHPRTTPPSPPRSNIPTTKTLAASN